MRRLVVASAAVAALTTGVLLAWYSVRQDREFQRLIAVGDAAMAADQTFAAIEAYSGALTYKPDAMLGYLKRGDSYRRRGELANALRDLRRAAELDPAAPRPVELLGDVNADMGRFDRAIQHYRSFIALDDRSPRVLYKLALTHYRSGQPAQAIEPLEQAVALEPQFAEASYLLGLVQRAEGRDDEALASLERAIEVAPTMLEAREELADLYLARGESRRAIDQLEAIAALDKAQPGRLVSVGLAYARLGQTDAAVLTLSRAAERFPDSPLVYTALGRVWLTAAEARDDRVALNKALEALQPLALTVNASSEALALYGRALYLSGRVTDAERLLQEATRRLPVDPLAYRYLADAADRLGQAAVARQARASYAALTTP